jgi:hypothetical protein
VVNCRKIRDKGRWMPVCRLGLPPVGRVNGVYAGASYMSALQLLIFYAGFNVLIYTVPQSNVGCSNEGGIFSHVYMYLT